MRFLRAQPERRGPIISAELSVGASAIVAPDAALAQSFLHCASGMLRPASGRVLLDQRAPYSDPELRARMPTLLPVEPRLISPRPWFPVLRPRRPVPSTVGEVVAALLTLRSSVTGERAVPTQELWLLDGLSHRPPTSLTPAELRRVSLALALSLESPLALLLDEPFAGLQEQEIPRVLEHIAQRAAGGAIVVFVVRQAQAAAHLAERVHFLRPADAARQGAPRYAVHSHARDTLSARLSQRGLSCAIDEHSRDRLHVSHPDEAVLLEQLTQALAANVDSADNSGPSSAVTALYADPERLLFGPRAQKDTARERDAREQDAGTRDAPTELPSTDAPSTEDTR